MATFASNVDRVQQIVNSAYKYDRKVVIEGRSMVNVIGTASELGYIKIPEGTLIDIDHLKNYPDEKTVLITTGSQGEAMAALSRMASGAHRKISIKPKDVVILSSTPIQAMKRQFPVSSTSCLSVAQRLFSRIPMYPDMRARKRSSCCIPDPSEIRTADPRRVPSPYGSERDWQSPWAPEGEYPADVIR